MEFIQELWGHVSTMLTNPMFVVFFATLLLMAAFPFKKKWKIGITTNKHIILATGTIVLLALYVYNHGFHDLQELFFHSHKGHRKIDLIIEMIQLFMGFECIEWCVKKSGLDRRLAKVVTSTTDILLLVFLLSGLMDNILMSLIGASIAVALFGNSVSRVPFKLFVGIIAAANLGGAYSFIGDTTTIMINVEKGLTDSEATPVGLLAAIIGSVPALMYLMWYMNRKMPKFNPITEPTPIQGNVLWMLYLGITGIIIGNLQFHQPGIGLLIGVVLGFFVGRVWRNMTFSSEEGFFHSDFGHILKGGAKGAVFISMLLIAADLLPLDLLVPVLDMFSKDAQAGIIGVASGVLDNIPLTAICLVIGGFSWALLAYTAGYGGSFFFFSSSGGVAVASSYERVANTKEWLPHTLHIGISYFIGYFAMLFYKHYFLEMTTINQSFVLGGILLVYLFLGYGLKQVYAPGRGLLRSKAKYIKLNWN